MNQPLPAIDKTYTLFLDRDGVINQDNVNGYILNWESFQFLPGVLDAFSLFSTHFGHIFIVTNQRGVGRGLMSLDELLRIHSNMKNAIDSAGGRIDAIFFCTATESGDSHRKPNPGMALDARLRFPGVDLTKSIMVGNTKSDMEFGRNIGAFTVYIHNREDKLPSPETVDARYDSLYALAKDIASR